MEYVELHDSIDDRFCRMAGAVDKAGRGIDSLFGEYGRDYGYALADEVSEGFIDLPGRGEVSDKLKSPREHLLLSDKAMTALREVRWYPGTRSIPLNVSRRGRELPNRHYYVYCHGTVDAIDYEKSRFQYLPGRPDAIASVAEYAFVPVLIPESDVFKTKQGFWIVNKNFVDIVEREQLTGFRFRAIWSG